MMSLDEEAVICDFAETYGIYDIYQHPCEFIATLAAGLRDNSRIKIKQSGLRISPELFALGAAVDRLSTLVWFQTQDGHKGINRPASVLQLISGERETQKTTRGYATGEDFQRAWARLAKGES